MKPDVTETKRLMGGGEINLPNAALSPSEIRMTPELRRAAMRLESHLIVSLIVPNRVTRQC